MTSLLVGALTAFWLGVLTSISPCPLATNVAAISFVGKRVSNTSQVLLSGLTYTLGRALAYLILAVMVVAGIMSIPGLSNFLQKYMNKILGPILIIVGMFLLELIQLNISWTLAGDRIRQRAEKGGIVGSGLLGIVFALSFCPISAALFFGSLIPLSVEHGSRILLPSLYGIGTGLPVGVFAVLIALGARSLGSAFNKLTQIEWWVRRITGGIFILVGIYYCLIFIFGLSLRII
jgi:cytochrome c biogenesis protein CcdA